MLSDIDVDQCLSVSGGISICQAAATGFVAAMLAPAGYYLAERFRSHTKRIQDAYCNGNTYIAYREVQYYRCQ